jgi:hypothetical protein
MQQYHIELDYRLTAQTIYQRATKLLAVYKKEKEHMLWMENQVETLDDYITTCMLAAEVTIHPHNFKDFSPKKVKAANMAKVWKLALQGNKDNKPAPMTPMEPIITNYPNMDTSGMHDKLAIFEELMHAEKTTGKQLRKEKSCNMNFYWNEQRPKATIRPLKQQSNSWHT